MAKQEIRRPAHTTDSSPPQRILPSAAAGAIVAAGLMLLLSLAAKAGIYEDAAKMMQQWHAFYDLSLVGIMAGMLEAAIMMFVIVYLFAWTSNKLQEKMA